MFELGKTKENIFGIKYLISYLSNIFKQSNLDHKTKCSNTL